MSPYNFAISFQLNMFLVLSEDTAKSEDVASKAKGKGGKTEKKQAEDSKPSDTAKKSAPQESSPAAEPPVKPASSPETAESKSSEVVPPAESNVAFDELGDAWTEAKPQKKKKKARKD